ncbi:MAG: Flp pilus assembly complex ATPase component TadA [Zoogloeaceae bacterium]|jgi:pilus assembly protein CpaF|nr:Flp pilus assembly complex ATPase component TadA [Zoogloeaceae bacterium]
MSTHRVIHKSPDGTLHERVFAAGIVTIGRDDGCDIVIKGWMIGKRHAEIRFTAEGARIFSYNPLIGIGVNGERVQEYGPLRSRDEIQLGNHSLFVIPSISKEAQDANKIPPVQKNIRVPEAPVSTVNGPRMFPEVTGGQTPSSAQAPEKSTPSLHVRQERPVVKAQASNGNPENRIAQSQHEAVTEEASDIYLEWRKKAHTELIKLMDVRRTDITAMTETELETSVRLMIDIVLESMRDLPRHVDREVLAEQVLHEAIGLGPLEPLLEDETVTEIMVNAYDQIFIERGGRIIKSPVSFTSDRAVVFAIERIVAPIGRKIDEGSPLVDARLKDGSRVNAIIPPLALKGPSLTIRKFPKHRLYGEDLIKFGTLNEAMLEFLSFCVRQAKNIIISGGTGSGKTTLLNILSNFIPDSDRIVTVEDAAELRLHQPNLVSLEARPANSEGKGAVNIRELVKNCLRMRPDRIVVGECRGGEALDMLQAMNTGHDGSLTTAHANSPRDMLSRLEVMVLMAGMDLPVVAIREQIASAINLIIQQTRFKCGSRKITAITEVTGVESGRIQLQDIFVFERDGYTPEGKVKGRFVATGAIPEFLEELREMGVAIPALEIFGTPIEHV